MKRIANQAFYSNSGLPNHERRSMGTSVLAGPAHCDGPRRTISTRNNRIFVRREPFISELTQVDKILVVVGNLPAFRLSLIVTLYDFPVLSHVQTVES